jgi:hypothetical protein
MGCGRCQAAICKTILPNCLACFEMLLSCSRLPKWKDAVDDGLDLFHSHEAHESAEFFPAAEGRAVNFQVLGNNRRNIIIGLTACGSATGY